jgi:plastocyanin
MYARHRSVRHVVRWGTLALLLSGALAALTLHAGRVASATSTVAIDNLAFTPGSITVAVGDSITWTNNQAGVPHTATADAGGFDSGRLSTGQSFSFTFSTPGTFTYHCTIHPFMHGSVTVTAASGGGTAPTTGGNPAATTPGQQTAQVRGGVNLIGVPAGTDLSAATAVFALNDAGTGYTLLSGAPAAGKGYVAFFDNDTTIALPAGSNNPVTQTLAAGVWLLIGNPSGTLPARVTGADALYTYDALAGKYVQATQLLPGQGAWVLSAKGAMITITPQQPGAQATPSPSPSPMPATQPTQPATNPTYTTPANNNPTYTQPMPAGGGGPYHY